MLNNIAMSAESCDGAGDKSRVVCQGCTGVRDLERRAVCNSFEQAEEGNFVRRKAWCERAG